ncbi:recombinase family protein [Actinoplanes sp. NEAU-A12]|uniref:Recombinase family protein n=1 Tax=Actinoplanes sandaracinus TaxID=3045177 RepID=A0ABT6X1P8_9ACTN|nr:recombinase family protein [Actinoplanes sandaracinus]MDI6105956.1 recombinase family protein [Actinoplanes sandaracinus]
MRIVHRNSVERDIRVRFGLGASIHDWNDPFGRLFLQTLAMVAEFEANLIRLRTREGMAVAKRKGKLRGKQPKLPESAQRSIRSRYAEGGLSLADLAEEYSRRPLHHPPHHPRRPGNQQPRRGVVPRSAKCPLTSLTATFHKIVRSRAWTAGTHLRHPVYRGVLDDREASDAQMPE